MSKLIFASREYTGVSNPLFNKFRRLSESGILISSATGFPRSTECSFYKTQHPIPDIFGLTTLSFKEATDLRVHQVIKKAEGNNLPIVVYWSGGIDSTVILSAILKHFPAHLLDRVIIKMSNASYVENPKFFKDVIQKQNIPYTNNTGLDYRNAMILHGDPADALWLGGNILTLEAESKGSYKANLVTHKDVIIKSFAAKTDNDYAEWLYNLLITSSSAHGFHLETITDLFWWLIFNHNYSSMCLKHVSEATRFDNDTLELYDSNFISWYNTVSYQAWSIQAQITGEKYDGSMRSYKMPAKQYIFDFDKNQHYRDFKSKMHSTYLPWATSSYVQAIYDDGTIILND